MFSGKRLLHASTFSMVSLQTLPARHYYPYFTDENTDTDRCEILPEITVVSNGRFHFQNLVYRVD